MAIKISSTNVIDNSRKLVNITGATGVYSDFHPQVSSITTALDFNLPVMTLTMSANTTFTESNRAAGKTSLFLLDTSSSSHTPTFSGDIKWKGGVTPTWSGYRYWQIILQCVDGTVVRGVANGYTAVGGGGGGSAPVEISDQSAFNFSKAGIGGTAAAKYKLETDGSAQRTNISGVYVLITGEWLLSGSASDYEANMGTGVAAPGSGFYTHAGSSAFDTWLNLGTMREWVIEATNTYAQTDHTLQIRYASNSAVIDTATISLIVDSAP